MQLLNYLMNRVETWITNSRNYPVQKKLNFALDITFILRNNITLSSDNLLRFTKNLL